MCFVSDLKQEESKVKLWNEEKQEKINKWWIQMFSVEGTCNDAIMKSFEDDLQEEMSKLAESYKE